MIHYLSECVYRHSLTLTAVWILATECCLTKSKSQLSKMSEALEMVQWNFLRSFCTTSEQGAYLLLGWNLTDDESATWIALSNYIVKDYVCSLSRWTGVVDIVRVSTISLVDIMSISTLSVSLWFSITPVTLWLDIFFNPCALMTTEQVEDYLVLSRPAWWPLRMKLALSIFDRLMFKSPN